MPNAERIAGLQRVAYGAGSTDAERRAALDELDALRHGRGDRHPATAAVPAVPDAEAPTPDAGVLEGGRIADGAEPTPEPARPARAHGRWTAVAIGVALALAVGYGAGSVGAGAASGASPVATAAPGSTPTDLPATPPPVSFVDVDETRVVEVFEREPTEAELAPDPILFSGFDLDDAGPRLLATRSDGLTVWAARTVEGDLCVVMRIDESSSGGGCTYGGLFPVAEGIGIETYHESLGNHSAFLDQWGDLRIRVDGVSGGPRT